MHTNKNLIFWTGILGVIFFVAAVMIGGLQFSNYSHISQYISESYAKGTPYGLYLSIFGYFPSGILIFIFSYSAIKFFPKSIFIKIGFWGLGIFYGFSMLLTNIFPCDPGCNREMINPSRSQIIHNLVGLPTYILVPFSLLFIGIGLQLKRKDKKLAVLAIFSALLSLLFSILLFSNLLSNYVGIYQRIIESFILLWILVCAFYIETKK